MKKGWGKALAVTGLLVVPISLFATLELFLILPGKWLVGLNLLWLLAALTVFWAIYAWNLGRRYALQADLRALIKAANLSVKQVQLLGQLAPGQLWTNTKGKVVFQMTTRQLQSLQALLRQRPASI